ncbi:DUF411 domain-containing protein [Neptuniibacter sp. CAU 1671]|uniref:DUF411 domain-containing protein n=1 Tax=Neptuniibacter sp. CAU 1671 TaxID=3032593 RepID=UPI0023D9F470|nr:DUF411 domain-containing protein [Neptuniibacter sp. CAU 1671]MDF2181609.1 DUF411 domain-containing protein [Neptuniibacter sp. CAU 1671]
MKKITFLRLLCRLSGAAMVTLMAQMAFAAGEELKVYKSPDCGCCGKWVEHLESQGLETATLHPMNLAAVKQHYGIKPAYRSCHTAVSNDGYVFEGHVPARFVTEFLQSPPEGALGLAVPGMPVGSPGMEMDQRFDPYEVILLKQDGTAEVYKSIKSPDQQY